MPLGLFDLRKRPKKHSPLPFGCGSSCVDVHCAERDVKEAPSPQVATAYPHVNV
jgi:hypothetical protein